jgi:tRNA (Thr-GGU) A37 N-methylase
MGFARSWSQREALKEWHALLPPSFSPNSRSLGIATLWKQNEPGRIQYTISASSYQALDYTNVTCIGSGKREVHLRSRPWQIDLLDNTPFVDTKPSRHRSMFEDLFRRTLGALSLESPGPSRGHHFTGHLNNEGTIIFVGTLPITVRSTHQDPNIQAPRLLSVAGEIHELTTYRSEAISVANPLDGHRVCHKSKMTIARTQAGHWENGLALTAETDAEEQAETTSERVDVDTSTQKISIDWRWCATACFTPSFSTALISHWFEVHLEVQYLRPNSNATLTLRGVFPTKLSVEPSSFSVHDNPPQGIPDYKSIILASDQGWSNSIVTEDPPSYQSHDGSLGASNHVANGR